MIKILCDKCGIEKNEKDLKAIEKGDIVRCKDFPNGKLELCGKCFRELVKFLGIRTNTQKVLENREINKIKEVEQK